MGLTKNSTGQSAYETGLDIIKQNQEDMIIALAGNPNVGKSTVFNNLTGMKQHTGNWPGKTVTNAWGYCRGDNSDKILVDLPGCYSLSANSAEEEVARDYICFGSSDAVIVVVDATCLERNLNLVLQTLEITTGAVLCINMMDEAKRKGINIDIPKLSGILGVPVVPVTARNGNGLNKLINTAGSASGGNEYRIDYPAPVREAVDVVSSIIKEICVGIPFDRTAIALIAGDASYIAAVNRVLEYDISENPEIKKELEKAVSMLNDNGLDLQDFNDTVVTSIVKNAEKIAGECVVFNKKKKAFTERKADRILTSRKWGFPIMFLMLAVIFYITITGANYPSKFLSNILFWVEDKLAAGMEAVSFPGWAVDALAHGVYRVVAWVTSVMLPPMAIFFPLFTILEDSGYLPRIAFNLDGAFRKCSACGKQALTMCMGFGCNAAGVIGCRIIDSPRERLIAIITNSFVPCNGRFPIIITVAGMFLVFGGGLFGSAMSALILTAAIVLGVIMTLCVSKILSKTMLKGVPSSFTLELPPYRKPQIGKVIIRSVFDRTLFVLGRAVAVAAPAGLFIWIIANVDVGGISILKHCTDFLDPFAKVLGLDGVILMAFILGLPANEIVIPIIIMSYISGGMLVDMESAAEMKSLLVQNGWTILTGINVILFTLFHWPCSTTLLTIKKETKSWKWTAVSMLAPFAAGVAICLLTTAVYRIFN